MIFDIRDSDGYTVLLKTEKGIAGKYSTTFARTNWTPDTIGTYTIRSFAISDSVQPEILSPMVTQNLEVIVRQTVQSPTDEVLTPVQPTTSDKDDKPTLDELKEYALERINEDRQKFGLSPVQLSNNMAAQVHAEDMFETKYLSHWMSNGEKPYMTYSRLGGSGAVAQNAAFQGFNGNDYNRCVSKILLCQTIDPLESIDALQYLMVYEDKECCNDGHRDNILDKYHTHVSVGIAYDDYYFAFVQNFENVYITRQHAHDTRPIISHDSKLRELTIEGKITNGQFSTLVEHANTITIYYDPLPTTLEYEKNKSRNEYDGGIYVACILQEQLTMYCPGATTVTASTWNYERSPNYDTFLIRASLDRVLVDEGIYTVKVTAESVGAKPYDESWPVAMYSIVYKKN
jgi:uncharacterized protein YkwD